MLYSERKETLHRISERATERNETKVYQDSIRLNVSNVSVYFTNATSLSLDRFAHYKFGVSVCVCVRAISHNHTLWHMEQEVRS